MATQRWLGEATNLAVCRTYNEGRVHLGRDLRAAAERLCNRRLTMPEVDFLNNANVYTVAQLFYFFRAYGLDTDEAVTESYIKLHNRDMSEEEKIFAELTEYESLERARQASERAKQDSERRNTDATNGPGKKAKRVRRDVSLKSRLTYRGITRFERAKINSPERIRAMVRRLTEGRKEGALRISQPDLQCLLMESMTEETCSTTCWQLRALKLVEWNWEGTSVIIDSSGILEGCFRRHLGFMADSLRSLFAVTFTLQPVINAQATRMSAAYSETTSHLSGSEGVPMGYGVRLMGLPSEDDRDCDQWPDQWPLMLRSLS
jgi:hypothetical protein